MVDGKTKQIHQTQVTYLMSMVHLTGINKGINKSLVINVADNQRLPITPPNQYQ